MQNYSIWERKEDMGEAGLVDSYSPHKFRARFTSTFVQLNLGRNEKGLDFPGYVLLYELLALTMNWYTKRVWTRIWSLTHKSIFNNFAASRVSKIFWWTFSTETFWRSGGLTPFAHRSLGSPFLAVTFHWLCSTICSSRLGKLFRYDARNPTHAWKGKQHTVSSSESRPQLSQFLLSEFGEPFWKKLSVIAFAWVVISLLEFKKDLKILILTSKQPNRCRRRRWRGGTSEQLLSGTKCTEEGWSKWWWSCSCRHGANGSPPQVE